MIRATLLFLAFFGFWIPAYAQQQELTAEKSDYEQVVDGIRTAGGDAPVEYVYSEEIRSFDAVLDLRNSPSLRVTERIGYDFMETWRHGIYRNILSSGPEGSTVPLLFTAASATGPNGETLTTQISGLTEDRKGPSVLKALLGQSVFMFEGFPAMLSIRIGDPDVEIKGFHTYVIRYSVENAIGYFEDFDEIYWDVTGNEWSYPIRSASATVILPTIVPEEDLRIASYCGASGATDSCGDAVVSVHEALGRTEVHFKLDGELEPHENMTVAVGFPKGIVAAPPPAPTLPGWVTYVEWWPLFVIAVLPFWLYRERFAYVTRRRAYYANNPVVPVYDFDELAPLEALAVYKGAVQSSKIGAEIVWLAAHGYLVITEQKKGVYAFESTEKDTSGLRPFDKMLHDGIVGHTNQSLKYHFYSTVRVLIAAVEEGLSTAGYQEGGKSARFRNSRGGAFGLCLFLAINPGLFIWVIIGWKVGLAFSGVLLMCGILALIVGAEAFLTEKGLAVERALLGLREYIQTAEQARLAYHHAPERKPEDFERLLPYVMIFGLERAWARHFESMSLPPPNWYHSSSSGAFSVGAFSSSMQSFSRSAGSSLSASPGGSSGGSGGGGSSGGGGGGGGGGSW